MDIQIDASGLLSTNLLFIDLSESLPLWMEPRSMGLEAMKNIGIFQKCRAKMGLICEGRGSEMRI